MFIKPRRGTCSYLSFLKTGLDKTDGIKQPVNSIKEDLVPNTLGWSMKMIGKTGPGKTTFVSAFTEFLIKYLSPKFKIF